MSQADVLPQRDQKLLTGEQHLTAGIATADPVLVDLHRRNLRTALGQGLLVGEAILQAVFNTPGPMPVKRELNGK